jgi:DNA polymerase-3 subunit delta'
MNLLELKSNNQKQLFSFENIFLDIINLYDKKKLPNKILFSGPKGTGKATLAYHLSNYVFSKKEEFPYDVNKFKINGLNKSYKLILNNSHPNFHLIDVLTDKKIIEISQIRQMINYANKSAFNNGERIVLIDNAENLNLNSLNALLKIVEEPNENIIFIIIFDNNKKILNTLKSRCLKFNLFLTFDQSIETVNTIIEKNVYDLISKDLINHYNTTGDFINLINFSLLSKIDLSEISLKKFLTNLIDEKRYKKDVFIKNNIYKYVEFYLLNLMKFKPSRNKITSLYKNFIHKIHDLKKFNLDEESFFIEFKTKVLDE